MKMIDRPEPIEIQRKHRKHPGFVDAMGKELNPGDEIIVSDTFRSYHAVITRFTPRRIYWKPLAVSSCQHSWFFDYEFCTQLHYWYSDGGSKADRNGRMTDPEPRNMFRRVIKLEGLK